MKEKIYSYILDSISFNDCVYENLISLYGISQVNETIMEVLRNKDINIEIYNKVINFKGNKNFMIANNLFIVRSCELLEELNNIFISLGYNDKKFMNMWMDDKINIVTKNISDVSILSRISELYQEFLFFRNKVCECNLRLVRRSVDCFKDQFMYDELYQEGFMGLMMAIEKFDYKRDIKFSTCAVNYISYAVREHIHDYEFSLNIPRDKVSTYYRIVKMQEEARNILGRELTLEELAQKLDVRVSTLLGYLEIDNFLCNYLDLRTASSLKSKNSGFREIEELLIDGDLETCMVEFLNSFKERDRTIINYRFFGKELRTFDEVGKLMGVSRQCVNVKYNRILKRMRRIGKELKRYY